MKTDRRQRTSVGTVFRLAARVLGLTGLLVFGVGAVLAVATWPALGGNPIQAWDTAGEGMTGRFGAAAKIASFLTVISAGGITTWLLIELVSGLTLVTGRKSAAGTNNALQTVLALALVVVVNAVSFQHYSRSDATRDQRFTLAPELREQLRKLDPKSPTTIVVLQMDKTSAAEPERSDALSSAAQAKIVEKVRDLVEEIREFGPQFDVHVLHTKDEEFTGKVQALTEAADGKVDAKKARLKSAIESAPENSIFFYHDGRIQRLGFNQFYLLDKTASRDEKNLVLIPQGKEAFVRKVLGVEARRPKVAVGVIHPWLSTNDNREEFSAPGIRKTLELNGYDVVDLILKKGWDGESPLGPAASTIRESQLEEVESQLQAATDDVAEAESQLQQLKLVRERTLKGPLTELDRMFRRVIGRPIDEEADRKRLLDRLIDPNISQRESDLAEAKKKQADLEPKFLEFTRDDALMAARRDPNIKARLAATLADCDLLILSRLTVMSLSDRRSIPASLHNLSKEQAEVIKDYLAAGKPAICCIGAADLGPKQQRPDEPAGPDDVEKLIRRLGVELGPQIIVTELEYQSMATRQSSPFGSSVDAPPLIIHAANSSVAPNPVGRAFNLSNRSLAGQLKVVRSGFRPVSIDAGVPLKASAEILDTTPESWNKNWPETAPFGSPRYLPKFEATKPTDERKGTRNEERKGSFPVGIAAEVPVPAEWIDDKSVAAFAASVVGAGATSPPGLAFGTTNPDRFHAAMTKDVKTTRLVVFGHGGLFNGKELDPGRETLLLQSVHWALKRDDQMPREASGAGNWRYPRVGLSPVEHAGWRWGTFLGLPLLAAYLGLIVLMFRRLR